MVELLTHQQPCRWRDRSGPAWPTSDYGLTRGELQREARRLRQAGWNTAEVAGVLVNPDTVPEQGWVA